MPASSPSKMNKMIPARRMEDQDVEMKPIRIGPPPYSSPDSATDGIRMLPLEQGSSSVAHDHVADEAESGSYEDMKAAAAVQLAKDRGLDLPKETKAEAVKALLADDAEEMDSADFVNEINEAQDQDALDAVGEKYAVSGKEYSRVEKAMEKRQAELDAQNTEDE